MATDNAGFSRRTFLRTLGTTAVAGAAAQAGAVAAVGEPTDPEQPQGPGPVPMTLRVNGQELKLRLEPRVTLLDALRNFSNHTGPKEVCDRASCGACTVLLDDEPVYACMKLAIEAQGHEVTTIEGLAKGGQLTPVQKAFIDRDALMCGFCTPGMVMSVTALLRRNPRPTADDVRRACAGNLCRCGTYPRVIEAALTAAGVPLANPTRKVEVISYAKLA